jgi:hypothetical protein
VGINGSNAPYLGVGDASNGSLTEATIAVGTGRNSGSNGSPFCGRYEGLGYTDVETGELQFCDQTGNGYYSQVNLGPMTNVGSVATWIDAMTMQGNAGGTVSVTFPSGVSLVDASAATQVKLPVAAGYASAAQGECGYDSTNLNWHCWDNGSDKFTAFFSVASPPTSGHVAGFLKTSNSWSLQDLGAPTSTPSFSAITTGTNAVALHMGTGGSLDATGTGTISATTAANLSGTPALPNGTTATTQTTGDNTTKIATDAFVLANAGGSGSGTVSDGIGTSTPGQMAVSTSTAHVIGYTTAPTSFPGFGTTSGTAAQGGVITAGGPTGSTSVVPVITYNAAGQLTTVGTASITPAAIGAAAINASTTGNAATATTATNLAGGAVGSLPNQSAAGTTAFIASPTTTGHTFVPAWQPSGSAVQPTAIDANTLAVASAGTAGTLTTALSANQLLGSLTAVAPTGQSVPSCSTAASALQWTSGTGFACNTSITAGATPLPTPGSSISLSAPRGYAVCTTTCTVTLPTPAAGYEFCAVNDDNVSTVITIAAISGVYFEKTARTGYETVNTAMTSGGAVGDKICMIGRDATHYLTLSYNGTWTP